MKISLSASLVVAALGLGVVPFTSAAFAADETKHDTMGKDGMAKDTMAKDGMAKDAMG